MRTHDELITQISKQIQNYRLGELGYPLDENHVDRWVFQFNKDVREIILLETLSLLSHCYFSKGKVKQFLFDVVECEKIWGTDDIFTEIQYIQFLNIQNKGSSQTHLLEMLNDLLEDNYMTGLSTSSTDQTNRYVYLDDCLFSGNTVIRDLERWISSAKDHSTLDIILLAAHSSGKYYLEKKILPNLCDQKGINYRVWTYKTFNNSKYDKYYYDCMWPKHTLDDNLSAFIEQLNPSDIDKKFLFRSKEYISPLYTGDYSRTIFEQEILKAGTYIHSCCAEPSKSMKPMGYDFFNTLGFGAFFATYKNISNNSPLAFWWGDPHADDSHPFSKWYPLLPRKGNKNDVITWE